MIFSYPIRFCKGTSLNAHHSLRNIVTVVTDLFEIRQEVDEHHPRVKDAFTVAES